MRDPGADRTNDPEPLTGHGPLADAEPDTGRPIDDPVLADRANPRWHDTSAPEPDAQPLANRDGSPNVMPAAHVVSLLPTSDDGGTPQDQAARIIESDIGRDNIRQGLGGGSANPALAEGGEAGDGS